MSNRLNVRRVRIETIDREGNVENTTYGIIAADDNASAYIDVWSSLEELNDAIDENPAGILGALDSIDFRGDVGYENYYGTFPD